MISVQLVSMTLILIPLLRAQGAQQVGILRWDQPHALIALLDMQTRTTTSRQRVRCAAWVSMLQTAARRV